MKVLIVVVLMFGSAAAQTATPSAQQEFDHGVAAYREGNYQEATQHFLIAVRQNPSWLNAHLYLATTYANQYIPGSETPENLLFLQHASDEFLVVLGIDPSNVQALKSLGLLSFNSKHYEMARQYYGRLTEITPGDQEVFYMLGVMDWIESYGPRMSLRSRLQIEPTGSLYDKPQCAELRVQNWERVDHGMKMLNEALRLKPDYDDAMAYLNLFYRERADIQCGSPEVAKADLKEADLWVDRAIKTKRDRACAAGRKDLCK